MLCRMGLLGQRKRSLLPLWTERPPSLEQATKKEEGIPPWMRKGVWRECAKIHREDEDPASEGAECPGRTLKASCKGWLSTPED
jgi:hypothetical protein